MPSEMSYFATEVLGTAGLPEKPYLPLVFVAPLGDQVPEDGVFTYTTVTNLSDIGKVEERSVILFREDQNAQLAVFAKHGEEFGRAVQAFFGVPGSTYGVWFEDAAFGLERVAYGALLAEMRAAAEVAAQTAANARSGTKVESDRYTGATGNVRYSTNIGVGDDSDVDDE